MADMGIGSGPRRPVQVRRVRRDGWSKARRQRFLDMLAGTCNVRMAAEAAGMLAGSAYALRRLDPEFDRLWREALVMGYERLETALLERALTNIEGHPREGDADAAERAVAEMDTQLIKLALSQYHAKATGEVSARRAMQRRVASEEETNAVLMKKLAVLEKQVRERL